MSIEAVWGFLRTNKLDGDHTETHEGGQCEGWWVAEKHRGYVVRPCRICGEPFICDPDSDATDCGDAHLQRAR